MDVFESLVKIVGKSNVTKDPAESYVYRFGHCPSGDTSDFGGAPDIVVMPETVEQVSEIVKLANETKTPIVPRGSGSSQYGGTAFEGGITLDMALMDKILSIDEDNMVIEAEGGCSVYKLMRALDQRNLRFPISPIYTSGPQVGSAVATNITGYMICRTGRMGDLIVGLEVVLPNGEVVTLGSGAYKEGYGHYHRYTGGPDTVGLFVNSMGHLGVITKVATRVLPKPLEIFIGYAWPRDKINEVTDCMYELQRYGVYDIYMMDWWGFREAQERGILSIPKDAYFIANIMEAAFTEEELEIRRRKVKEICERYGGSDVSELSYSLMGPPKWSAWDSGCSQEWGGRNLVPYWYNPVKAFPDVYELWERLVKKYNFWDEKHYVGWFSWADRNTMNPYPIVKVYHEELDRTAKLWNELNIELTKRGACQYAIGGTLPIEVVRDLGPAHNLVEKIKGLLDPNGIMNPSPILRGDSN
ncbi:MAG: FAD-binding oxidoreductase [Candidatus Thorarchaeota archaeon]